MASHGCVRFSSRSFGWTMVRGLEGGGFVGSIGHDGRNHIARTSGLVVTSMRFLSERRVGSAGQVGGVWSRQRTIGSKAFRLILYAILHN